MLTHGDESRLVITKECTIHGKYHECEEHTDVLVKPRATPWMERRHQWPSQNLHIPRP